MKRSSMNTVKTNLQPRRPALLVHVVLIAIFSVSMVISLPVLH